MQNGIRMNVDSDLPDPNKHITFVLYIFSTREGLKFKLKDHFLTSYTASVFLSRSFGIYAPICIEMDISQSIREVRIEVVNRAYR